VEILCNADETVVRDKCTPPFTTSPHSLQFPLHLLIKCKPPKLEVSNGGECFRLFLHLYPASAGIKDGHEQSPYDLAVVTNSLGVYFIRLLLASADPTIDPVRRRNLNYAARRDGMFLAFRASSTNRCSIIWARIRHEGKELL
jgi:hypothetical protein